MAARTPWVAELGQRFKYLWPLKFAGTTAYTWLFFIGYFHLLRHPAYPITQMPLTPLDHWIPFQPSMLIPYLSLWLYVGLAPAFQRNFGELVAYGLWVGGLCITGLTLFYFFPTAVPPLTIDVSGHPGFAVLQGVDASGNACPSMHVAAAIFTALRLSDVFRQARVPAPWRWANMLWFAAIVWSTVAVRQHVVLDAVAGAALGGLFALASLRWRSVPWLGRSGVSAYIIDRKPMDKLP
jgi:membrane-associated phospholipid phosphatase